MWCAVCVQESTRRLLVGLLVQCRPGVRSCRSGTRLFSAADVTRSHSSQLQSAACLPPPQVNTSTSTETTAVGPVSPQTLYNWQNPFQFPCKYIVISDHLPFCRRFNWAESEWNSRHAEVTAATIRGRCACTLNPHP